ncbi:hypothetical protein MKW92_016954, partial [Papaver armeniacum]
MLHARLGLEKEEIVNLYYTPDDPCSPAALLTNDDFFKFWDTSVSDEADFIHLQLSITNSEFGDDDFLNAAMELPLITNDETPKKTWKTNKKVVSKEKTKPPRRSPRLNTSSEVQNFDQQGGASRKLCFVDLLNEVQSMSCLSQASRVGTNTTQ